MTSGIMTTEGVGVGPETDVAEVTRILLVHGISAAPVIDRDGHILEMVSEGHLMRRGCGRARSWRLSVVLPTRRRNSFAPTLHARGM